MVPGVHNIKSVGSSPLRRGGNILALQNRDRQYLEKGGAGASSTKVNSKSILPAITRPAYWEKC